MNDRILYSLLMVKNTIIARRENQKGASAVEYGLLVAGIAALIVVVVFAFGGMVSNIFNGTKTSICANATTSC
jgi:pilus assembly protein Flp/PilA